MGAALSSQGAYNVQQEFAAKLAHPGPCTIVAFMSPRCGLCASLRPALDQIASSCDGSSSGGIQVAVLDAQEDKLWAPEMLAYDVHTVPCFVLLEPGGSAVCKTPAPRSRQQMEAALAAMAEHARGRSKKQES